MGGDVRRRLENDEISFLRSADARLRLGCGSSKVSTVVDFVGDRQELLNIINEMIGELNASHTGAAPPTRGPGGGGVSTGNLGLELEPDSAAGRYRVTYIYENGPD